MMHAFCVLDAESVEVRSTMPEDFSYRQQSGTFSSNTVLFGDSDVEPKAPGIVRPSQCRSGKYLMPSHEIYRRGGSSGSDNNRGFSYEGITFGLDIVPSAAAAAHPDPAVTVCAFVPEPSLWGQMTGGWDKALREAGFRQDTFEDSSEMIWEVHCKKVTASESAAAAAAALAKAEKMRKEEESRSEGAGRTATAVALKAKKVAARRAAKAKRAAANEARAARKAAVEEATEENLSAATVAEKAAAEAEAAEAEASAIAKAVSALDAAKKTGGNPKRAWLRGSGGSWTPAMAERPISTEDRRLRRSFLF